MRDDTRRLVRWYLRKAQLADHLVTGERPRACPEPVDDIATSGFDSADEAWAWLALNRLNLLSLVHTAGGEGLHFESWALAEAMWAYFSRNVDDPALAGCYESARRSAFMAGDHVAERRLRNLMSRAGGTAERRASNRAPDAGRPEGRNRIGGTGPGDAPSGLYGTAMAGGGAMGGMVGGRLNRAEDEEDEDDWVFRLTEEEHVWGFLRENDDPYA